MLNYQRVSGGEWREQLGAMGIQILFKWEAIRSYQEFSNHILDNNEIMRIGWVFMEIEMEFEKIWWRFTLVGRDSMRIE